MQLYTAFPFQSLVRRTTNGLLRTAVLLLAALPVLSPPVQADTYGKQWIVLGPIEVHLVFTDADGKQQEISLAKAPKVFLQKLTPRLQKEATRPILDPDTKVRFAESFWGPKDSEAVCRDAAEYVLEAYPPGGPNETYELVNGQFTRKIFCTPAPAKVAYMTQGINHNVQYYFPVIDKSGATVLPADPGRANPMVSQLQISFYVPPVNHMPFRITTPGTCEKKGIGCGLGAGEADPHIHVYFDVYFSVLANSTEADSLKFGPTPEMHVEYQVLGTNAEIMWGFDQDVVKGVEAAIKAIVTELAVAAASAGETDGISLAPVIAHALYIAFKYGIGALVDAIVNQDLPTLMNNSFVGALFLQQQGTPAIEGIAKKAGKEIKTLLLAVDSGSRIGFTKLDVDMAKHSMVFKLTYPTPAKPQLGNATVPAKVKNPIHLVTPAIGTHVQQVKAGLPVMVNGSNFSFNKTYTSSLNITWNKTVAGLATSQLEWGPKGGATKKVDIKAGFDRAGLHVYQAANLKEGTTYQFRVHECDAIACAPWTDWFMASTESATQSGQTSSSDQVTLWLDNDVAQPIGTATIGPRGFFNTKVTIPANTTAGRHTINASAGVGGQTGMASVAETPVNVGPGGVTHPTSASVKPQASTSITVIGAAAGKVGPTISVLNGPGGTATPPPVTLQLDKTISLHGAGFAPAVVVNIHLDSPAGPKIGSATPNKLGMFVGNFKFPATAKIGNHEIVAVQVRAANKMLAQSKSMAGQTSQATVQVTLQSPPK